MLGDDSVHQVPSAQAQGPELVQSSSTHRGSKLGGLLCTWFCLFVCFHCKEIFLIYIIFIRYFLSLCFKRYPLSWFPLWDTPVPSPFLWCVLVIQHSGCRDSQSSPGCWLACLTKVVNSRWETLSQNKVESNWYRAVASTPNSAHTQNIKHWQAWLNQS